MRVPVKIYDAIVLQTDFVTAVGLENEYAIVKLYDTEVHTWDWAAMHGHHKVVKWLHENRAEGCTKDAMFWAALNGHLEVVKWLHENRTEGCTKDAMDYAARNGHLEIVKWLDIQWSMGNVSINTSSRVLNTLSGDGALNVAGDMTLNHPTCNMIMFKPLNVNR